MAMAAPLRSEWRPMSSGLNPRVGLLMAVMAARNLVSSSVDVNSCYFLFGRRTVFTGVLSIVPEYF